MSFERRCALCLLKEREVDPWLREMKKKYPDIEMGLSQAHAALQLVFRGERPVDFLAEETGRKFPTFYYGEGKIEEAVHREMIARKKTLALAESCTGGALAACLTALPGASQYLLGSIVAYANAWKERFLLVSHSTLEKKGAVSREAVEEMAAGILAETDADYAVAVSGVAGPGGGTKETPVGTIYVAVGERRGKIDAGRLQAPHDRAGAIDLAVHAALGALWRRLVHHTVTFS